MKNKSVSVNMAQGKSEAGDKDGMVNVAIECTSGECWTPKSTWCEMEIAEEWKVYFMDVALGDHEEWAAEEEEYIP
jgi:hypothetical protein